MTQWNKTNVHFGHVAENSTQEFTFVYTGPHKIKQVKTGCSCTTADLKDNSFTVKWNVGGLNSRRVYKKERVVKVTFEGTPIQNELKLEAMLQRKLP